MQGANAPKIPAEVTAIANIPYKWNGAWAFASDDHRGMFKTSKRSFMPRVGIAIRLTDKSSLRAGYARSVIPVSQTQPFQTTAIRLYGYTARTLVAPPLTGVPQATLADPFPASNPLVLPDRLHRWAATRISVTLPTSPLQDLRTGVRERMNVSFQQQILGRVRCGRNVLLESRLQPAVLPKVLNLSDPQLGYTHKTALSRTVPNPFYQYLTPELFPGQLRNRHIGECRAAS